jgi:hypothetical protein
MGKSWGRGGLDYEYIRSPVITIPPRGEFRFDIVVQRECDVSLPGVVEPEANRDTAGRLRIDIFAVGIRHVEYRDRTRAIGGISLTVCGANESDDSVSAYVSWLTEPPRGERHTRPGPALLAKRFRIGGGR